MLNAHQSEIVGFFVQVAQTFAVPKSVGEVYGLLFASKDPLNLEDVIEALGMSRGSASQGLKMLRGIKAVNLVYKPSDRRDNYVAETELRKLVGGFLKERIVPELERGVERLAQAERSLSKLPEADRAFLSSRLDKLRAWQKQAQTILPSLAQALEA